VDVRRCDRPDCSRPAAASLSYRYEEQAVWVGNLLPDDSQHHLCAPHADRLKVPIGWQLIDLRVDPLASESFAPDAAVA
jgi:hypothetical protein